MKKIKFKVLRFVSFITICLLSLSSHADTIIEERNFILSAKIPLIPKISIMQISTQLTATVKEKYKLTFKVETLNIVDFINNINGEGYVSGYINDGTYIPLYYKYDYTRKSKKKLVILEYLNGNISKEKFIPPFDKNKLTPIQNSQKNNTVDPATLFLRLLELSKTNKCNEDIKIYDGKRRYDIIL